MTIFLGTSKNITFAVLEVQDSKDRFMGFEFEINDLRFFYAANQWLWAGLRAGRFPCDVNGNPFPKEELLRVERAP